MTIGSRHRHQTAGKSQADSWPIAAWCAGMLLMLLLLLAGCSVTREYSKSPRTSVEQLLLSQALERSLREVALPIPDGVPVLVETTTLTADQRFLEQVVSDRLARSGMLLTKPEEAVYRVRVVTQSFGTEQGTSFFGMPPVQSVLLPFALPELALYKHVHQEGAVRMMLDVFEIATGRLISSSPWYGATTYHDQYTILLFFSFSKTDLRLPS